MIGRGSKSVEVQVTPTSERTARILRTLFYAYVAITFVHIAYVVYREPFAFDAWNIAVDTDARPASVSRFFEFWHRMYTSSNPRIGQPMAYLAYKTVGFAELGTPLAYFAIVLGGFVLGTGRFPSRRNGRDLATLAIGLGLLWFVSPNFPAYMFCRAYATNYVWAAAIQIWFLVALRIHDVEKPTPKWKLLGCFALAIAAGMGNEHVGPTLLVFTIAFIVHRWRQHHLHSGFFYVGALGAVLGYALIFFAPGQGQRYEGLAERFTVTQQILVRGITGNLDIMQGMLFAAAPLLVLLVAIIATGLVSERRDEQDLAPVRTQQRDAILVVGFTLLGGALITMTVFASPLLGPRFYMHAMLLLLAGVLGVVRAFLHSRRSFTPFVVMAVLASGYAAARTIPLFTAVDRASTARLAELAATPAGGVYTADAWDQVSETWWFLGDDFRDQKKRELVANYFALDRVLFRGSDQWATLGVTDVKLTMHYDFDPPLCIDEVDQLDLKPYIGKDVGALHHAFLDAIAEIQRVTSAKLHYIDVVATFLGSSPPLPRDKVYVARWRDGVFEGYTAAMGRVGRSKDRKILLSPELQTAAWEIFLVAIGDPPKRLGTGNEGPFLYQPWRTAQYWILACKPDHCFVTYTAHHKI
ncbi:MAG: hypothetical protein H6Q90_2992 [Deltaproteobacteria bacterium]|nr:hypothetical protein [Deltaproteobacteria bacterium]